MSYLMLHKFCNSPLTQREKEKSRDFQKRRFCNRSCSTRFTNQKHPKPKKGKTIQCSRCQLLVQLKPCKGGGYVRRKYCNSCLTLHRKEMALKNQKGEELSKRTKREVFSNSASWQAARSKIRRVAHRKFHEEHSHPRCQICGYDKHVEVCHIQAVSSFPDDALVSEINALSNLIGLCPNHHWELDHGSLKL